MSPAPYTEDQLVEQPAIGLFAELGWQTVSAMEEKFGEGGTLGRETSGEVVLAARLRAALNALLVLGWRQKIQSRARVRIAIEDTLDEGLPSAYTKELFAKKSEVLFEHVSQMTVRARRFPVLHDLASFTGSGQ